VGMCGDEGVTGHTPRCDEAGDIVRTREKDVCVMLGCQDVYVEDWTEGLYFLSLRTCPQPTCHTRDRRQGLFTCSTKYDTTELSIATSP
jgi:hypothetical protein